VATLRRVGSVVCAAAIANLAYMKYEVEKEKALNPRREYDDEE
jgi:hypothetical protein